MASLNKAVPDFTLDNPLPDIKRQYEKDGFVIVRGLLSPGEVGSIQKLRNRIDEEAAESGFEDFTKGRSRYEFEKIPTGAESVRSTLRAVKQPWYEEPVFRSVVACDRVLDTVQELIGPEVFYHSSKMLFKAAKGGRRKPWHQDWAYWDHMSQRQVTVWFAIDESTRENGCIEVIPESHKNGVIKHYHGEDFMIHEELIKKSQVVYAEMKPGDVLFFDVLTLHASAPNNSDNGRLCSIIDYDSEPKPEGSKFGSLKPLRTG